jgi:F-type H+-transporting ATPase subunit delta
MKDRKLAARYARALIGALPDAASRDRTDSFLTALSVAESRSAELRAVLLDPAVASAAKTAVLTSLAEQHGAGAEVVRFLATLVTHGRLSSLASIAEVFHEQRLSGQGIVTATLTAAVPLADDLTARAAAALEKLSGRKVQLRVEVDPALLGGATARVGSMVYDGSLKTQLARLRSRLGEE